MFRIITFAMALLVLSPHSALADATGFRKATIGAGSQRPLEVAIWYPAQNGRDEEVVGENLIFVGSRIAPGALPKTGHYPVVLLSHGYGGNWTNQLWLATALVKKGFIVAAPNHPGTATHEMDNAHSPKLWERPRDLSRVLDTLATDPVLSSAAFSDTAYVVGHSLGGWTAMELVGGVFDADRFDADCEINDHLAACQIYREMNAGKDASSRKALGAKAKDPRVKAAVSLDLGLARGFSPESLSAIDVPVLVIAAAERNDRIPAELESGYLQEHLPPATTRFNKIPGAAHFSFLAECKAGASLLLAIAPLGDSALCHDGTGRRRAEIHADVAAQIVNFLTSLPSATKARADTRSGSGHSNGGIRD